MSKGRTRRPLSLRRRCATCWKKVGTSESNWLCPKCVNREANRGWAATPREEIYGIEIEDGDDASPVPDIEPGQYETSLCIEIMKQYCNGQSQRTIAESVKCQRVFVRRTIYFWRSNYGYFVDNLKNMLARKC